MPVGRAHEGHHAVAGRAVDRDPGLHHAVAGRVDVVDLEGEMAEMARLAVVLAVPVVGELDERRAPARLPARRRLGVVRRREEDERIATLRVVAAADFLEAERIAIEFERAIKIAHAQHRMQISHGRPLGGGPLADGPSSRWGEG